LISRLGIEASTITVSISGSSHIPSPQPLLNTTLSQQQTSGGTGSSQLPGFRVGKWSPPTSTSSSEYSATGATNTSSNAVSHSVSPHTATLSNLQPSPIRFGLAAALSPPSSSTTPATNGSVSNTKLPLAQVVPVTAIDNETIETEVSSTLPLNPNNRITVGLESTVCNGNIDDSINTTPAVTVAVATAATVNISEMEGRSSSISSMTREDAALLQQQHLQLQHLHQQQNPAFQSS
jgi:hypothetical protein